MAISNRSRPPLTLSDEVVDADDLKPPRRFSRGVLVVSAALVVLGVVLAVTLIRGKQELPTASAQQPAATASASHVATPQVPPVAERTLWDGNELATESSNSVNVPSGHRVSISAAAPIGLGSSDLGRPFDGNFKPIHGPNSTPLFPQAGEPKNVRVDAFSHEFVVIDSEEKLKANVSVWVAEAHISHRSTEHYMAYRALQISHVLKLQDDGPMRKWPEEAVYYLAEIHYGHSYDAIVHGQSNEVHGGVKAMFTSGSGEIDAFAKQESVQASFYGRGMKPRKNTAIFARTPAAVDDGYVTSDEPVAVSVVYRRIPGVRVIEKKIKWETPTIHANEKLKDGQFVEWKLPPGSYRLRIETPVDAAKFSWKGAVKSQYDCAGAGKEWSKIGSDCRLAGGGGLKVENPCLLCAGSTIPVRVTVWKIGN